MIICSYILPFLTGHPGSRFVGNKQCWYVMRIQALCWWLTVSTNWIHFQTLLQPHHYTLDTYTGDNLPSSRLTISIHCLVCQLFLSPHRIAKLNNCTIFLCILKYPFQLFVGRSVCITEHLQTSRVVRRNNAHPSWGQLHYYSAVILIF